MDKNLLVYSDPTVVAHYCAKSELSRCEAYLVEKYFPAGLRVLDIGVGGGRTTPALSAQASRYVGVDYSGAMVEACRSRFPQLEFHKANAIDLSRFEDAAFDAAMFAFNGVDYIASDAQRAQCLREIARVLSPGGIFVFSSHNARALVYPTILSGAAPHKAIWRLIRSAYKSLGLSARNLPSRAFREGEGYIVDPTHGGLDTYVSTPAKVRPQIEAAGFELLETVGGLHPKAPAIMQPWFYYAVRKIGYPDFRQDRTISSDLCATMTAVGR